MVHVHVYGRASSCSHRQGARAREQSLPGTNHTGLGGAPLYSGRYHCGGRLGKLHCVCVTTVRVWYTAAGPSRTRRSQFSRPAGNRVDSGCEVAALTSNFRNAPVPCNAVASSWQTLAGEIAGGGVGRIKELLPGSCCAVIGRGEIDGINPPGSPPWAQDGSAGPVVLASLSGSPVPIGHVSGMSPDCKLELRVRRVCARVFGRARVYFQSVEVSPSWTPHRLSVRTGLTMPPLAVASSHNRWRGVSIRCWIRG